MPKKIATVAEILQVGFYLASKGNDGPIPGIETAFKSDGYPWCEQEFHVICDDFEIWSTRQKHRRDQRIRNSAHYVENPLAFAIYCVEFHPKIHTNVKIWSERLLSSANIAFSLKGVGAKKIAKGQLDPMTINQAVALVNFAKTGAPQSAQF
ncbi:hypothetical protein [Sphingopyxis sp. Root1497]|uniref:hypothetical protein n=1 Tax=Sphingopyxis sp. Root1497 TaxID=1736474 RepID=UPI000AEA3C86|nr:hypothetical protein [Sphingopyxis sp. Root1497]